MPVHGLKLEQLDKGEARLKLRKRWWQVWRPTNSPPPAPSSFDSATVIPLHNASLWSIMTYSWVTPLLVLGYLRPLQATDLWKMDPDREVASVTKNLDIHWARRVDEAEQWNKTAASGQIKPRFLRKSIWAIKSIKRIPKGGWKKSYDAYFEKWAHREPSLAWALNDTLGWQFWLSGAAKIVGDTSQLMGPLLVKAIINFGKKHYAATTSGDHAPPLGPGIGMAIGLFFVTVTSVTMQQQFFWRSMSTGVLARAALIASIYKRGVFLAPSSRPALPNSVLVNHISTDISRIDDCAQWFHAFWTAPVQVMVCLIILLVQLGPSALAGFCLFLVMTPIQQRAMAYQFRVRQKSMRWTDLRAKLVQELLGAMRVVKWFTYEEPLLQRVGSLRKQELKGIFKILLIRAANQSVAYSIPVLAAVLAFVSYILAGNGLDPAIIFSSLSLFQLLRQPLMFLPRSLSAIADAQSALIRLRGVFLANQMEENSFVIDPTLDVAVRVKGASFQWEESKAASESHKKGSKKAKKSENKEQSEEQVPPDSKQQEPFSVKDLTFDIPRGELCAIVGSVGSGKSSVLLGLIGEMRRTAGSCVFGGSVSYCSQTAWIQNATLRDNILFGQPLNEEKYWQVVRDSCLLPDLETLPNRDLTEIGEKGINLSGGQRQRVNIARALYRDADIVIMDDPLSAVDAHVGKALFVNVILNSLKRQGKTVLLVTHALHFLSQVDYVYTVVNGHIAEKGTYDELIERGGAFSKLVTEFAGVQVEEDEEEAKVTGSTERPNYVEAAGKSLKTEKSEISKKDDSAGKLIKAEKRTVGSVSYRVYYEYLKAGQGIWTVPLILLSAILMQASSVLNTYALVWWQNNAFNKSQAFYMILYASLGISQAIFTFLLGTAMSGLSIFASQKLYWKTMRRILYAPMIVFDTTPLGRLLSVLGKDIDVLDNQLSVSVRMFIVTISTVLGAILIVTILTHYFVIAAAVLFLGYGYFVSYYRVSARELKRLDANLRSLLYSHFSESLSGLPTIRAYGEIPRFLSENHYYIDLQSRALYPIVTNQRWLAVRLGFLGSLLVFVVGLLVVIGVNGIDPAQIGLALTYTTSLTQSLNMVTRQSAEVENYMNSVERVVQYSSDTIEQEAPHEKDDSRPPKDWPSKGSIKFNNVFMNYRPGLPPVLKGISLNINGGEKIGVVGRTGAGKSSLTVALFRLVELTSGSILLDDIDIATLGLREVRSKIAIIPQEPLLFSGTIRSNLDPFSIHDDAHLWDALRRAHLIETVEGSDFETEFKDNESTCIPSGATTPTSRFNLDTIVESEGGNLSVGERSLLSLARALVKNARVIVLDEATASVDLKTDAKVQATIQDEFRDKTLICIAHRLRTILSYDRILVMDNGVIVEFDSPLNLFSREGIFHSMCVQSNITHTEIEKSRYEYKASTV